MHSHHLISGCRLSVKTTIVHVNFDHLAQVVFVRFLHRELVFFLPFHTVCLGGSHYMKLTGKEWVVTLHFCSIYLFNQLYKSGLMDIYSMHGVYNPGLHCLFCCSDCSSF